jgi:hypothetical protein
MGSRKLRQIRPMRRVPPAALLTFPPDGPASVFLDAADEDEQRELLVRLRAWAWARVMGGPIEVER